MGIPNFLPTEKGRTLVAKALAGETIRFSRISLGFGDTDGDTQEFTELISPFADVAITDHEVGNGFVRIIGHLNTADISEEIYIKEIGVFATDPDEGEVLYSYVNSGPSMYLMYINPSYAGGRVGINTVVAIGGAKNIEVIIGGAVGYVTEKTFNEHTGNTENPHGVTKRQVGLENVVNKSPEDTTVAYTLPKELSELQSGEKNSAAFGKIAAAVKALITHLSAKGKDNPHALEAEDIGAAKKGHTHSTDDLKSGVLEQNRGGTGCASMDLFVNAIAYKAHIPIFGYFVGDGTEKRQIELGFKPSAVLLFNMTGKAGTDDGIYGGLAIGKKGVASSGRGCDYWDPTTAMMINDTGFWVNYSINTTDASNSKNIKTNQTSMGYRYIAWR